MVMKPKKDDRKNKILIISIVKPFPGESGQQMRVRHTIEAIKPFYHITFLTTTTPNEINLTKNKTTLVIAHRMSTIHNADNIFVLNQGKIINSGNHDFLIKNCNTYKSLYQKQLR